MHMLTRGVLEMSFLSMGRGPRRGPLPTVFLLACALVCASILASCAQVTGCPAAERSWLTMKTFAQVDRIEEGWAVLVDDEVDEHVLPIRCLPRGVSEGAIFRRGRRDRAAERRIYAQVCAWLMSLPTVPPASAATIRCRAPP